MDLINSEICSRMKAVIQILNDNYGENRHPISDLGGVLIFIEEREYWRELKELFGIQMGMEEYQEVFEMIGKEDMTEFLFQISSDYGVLIYSYSDRIQV